LAIARALAADPQLLLCDEAVSALDVSTQNQIVNLLMRLQRELGVSLLFIAHDLTLVRAVSSRVAVMYLGRIMETGPVRRLFDVPAHPYTEALLSAVPVPEPVGRESRQRILLEGDPPDPAHPPSGCMFHTRCRYRMAVCSEVVPPEIPVAGGGTVACHLHQGPVAGPLHDVRPAIAADQIERNE
jgi:oligopeptide/dipeptide ABC transporter ATP-binding protein